MISNDLTLRPDELEQVLADLDISGLEMPDIPDDHNDDDWSLPSLKNTDMTLGKDRNDSILDNSIFKSNKMLEDSLFEDCQEEDEKGEEDEDKDIFQTNPTDNTNLHYAVKRIRAQRRLIEKQTTLMNAMIKQLRAILQ